MDRSWMPTTAGVLNIICGVVAVCGALALIFAGSMVGAIPEIAEEPDAEVPLAYVSGLLLALALMAAVVGAVAIIGGVVALRRTGWAWPLVGAIAAFFCAAPIGALSLVLVILAEKELRGGGNPPAQLPAAEAG